jgi:hypothetical protein
MIRALHLDSGGFSSFTIKYHVPLNEYALYLCRYGEYFDCYYNLDDHFDDPDNNAYNQSYIEKLLPSGAKRPIPVIHDPIDPLSEVKMYVDDGHDYIALGSMGAYTKIETSVMEKIRQTYPEIRFHLFGNLKRKVLETVRPYSADSSTWAIQAVKGGAVYYWRPQEKKVYAYYVGGREKEDKSLIHIKKSPHWGEIESFLDDKLGYTYKDLVKVPEARQVMNLYYYIQYEEHLNSLEKA